MSTNMQRASDGKHMMHNDKVPSQLEATPAERNCGDLLAKCLVASTHSTVHNSSTIFAHNHPTGAKDHRVSGSRVSKSSAGHYASQVVEKERLDRRQGQSTIQAGTTTDTMLVQRGKPFCGHLCSCQGQWNPHCRSQCRCRCRL